MADPFDIFEPFEPLEPLEAAEGAARGREPRPTRRWSAPAARPTPPVDAARAGAQGRPEAPARAGAQDRLEGPKRAGAQGRPEGPKRAGAQGRPEAPTRRLPTGADFEDALEAVLFGGPAGRSADEVARGSEDPASGLAGDPDGDPASPALVPEADLTTFRAVALPELEAAVARLSARGHLASLTDDLARREPAVVVRFRPNQGPLAAFGSTAREPARFELRLAADLDGETQVVAGYTPGGPDAPFTLLSRTRISAVRADWVAQRFLDFVRRTLALD